jgi:hypothetical protein
VEAAAAVAVWLIILAQAVVVLEYLDKDPMVLLVQELMAVAEALAALRVKQQLHLKAEMVEDMAVAVVQQ